ncbi:hypothetical protein H6F85_16580 [Microcoleus sp. FACHB-45]|nr:hypothetical protein [Microcoleus sp. FACHB-84]MBD2010328.1 hypothetical protein [Microcoleus sp. FACHB-45]
MSWYDAYPASLYWVGVHRAPYPLVCIENEIPHKNITTCIPYDKPTGNSNE